MPHIASKAFLKLFTLFIFATSFGRDSHVFGVRFVRKFALCSQFFTTRGCSSRGASLALVAVAGPASEETNVQCQSKSTSTLPCRCWCANMRSPLSRRFWREVHPRICRRTSYDLLARPWICLLTRLCTCQIVNLFWPVLG